MADLALDELVAPMTFSPQLEAAIAEVTPSTDPIDAPDFDPIAHINRLFPNEDSLLQVDSYVGGLHERMRGLEEEVLLTVRQQTSAGSSARRDLENGRQAVAELFVKVRDIKSKAEASEAMVHEICRDIKSLDYAKRHLTLTIRALKRLQMLVTAVEQLVVMTQERMYAEAANLLQAVNSLLVHFEDYGHVKKVAELREQIDEVKTNLRKQVFDDFNQLSAEGSEGVQPSNVETLKGACVVVDALGSGVRKEMIAWFSGWQFAPYKHAFQPYAEYGTLEKAELRYAWHKKMLEQYDSTLRALFPPSWQVAMAITRDFCSITNKHLEEILDQSRGSLDVALLTHVLQKTVDFEEELCKRFTAQAAEEAVDDDDDNDEAAAAEGDAAANSNGASPAKKPRVERLTPKSLLGSISNCFDPYMGIYVSLADKTLDERIAKVLEEETWRVASMGRADGRVFNSSKELFLAIRKSYKLGTQLHMGNVLLELHRVWGKHLKAYSKKVAEQLPQIKQPADPSMPPEVSLDLAQQQQVCAVVNTCEYCGETTGQLAETIAKQLDDQMAEKVDLSAPQEDFQGVVMEGMKVLVAVLESRVAASLKTMTRMPWETLDELGEDTSTYMTEIVKRLREMLPQLGEALLPLYVRWFCDKFVASFVPRFIGHIYRCRRIGEVGAQQLQVDVGTLKATLLDLPTLGQANATGAYGKLVNDEIGKAEQVLKLVQTPEDFLEATVAEIRGAGVSIDLQKILELKGLKKADSDRLVEAYSKVAGNISNMAESAMQGKNMKKIFGLGA